MKEPMEMIKFFAVNQKVGKRYREGRMTKGHWIYGEDDYCQDGYFCSKCGHFVRWNYPADKIGFIKDYNYCPNCGADMRDEQE